MKKILLIRFSAMGDVVLTSPVIRCLKQKYPASELHFLVKHQFKEAVESNPHISQLHCFDKHPSEVIPALKKIGFEVVIDLQRNRKSAYVRSALKSKSYTFPKLNIQKFLYTFFKINRLPKIHVVDRYFKAVKALGVVNDYKGLDFYFSKPEPDFTPVELAFMQTPYVVLVLGATYYTKRIPKSKLEEIIVHLKLPVVLLGGPAEKTIADELTLKFPHLHNTVGQTTLQQSAKYIQFAQSVITPDTGLMHIAAAFQKPIVSVWGNTVPDFGMYPYLPGNDAKNIVLEIQGLNCRPCSKLGHQHCPKKHFNCMLQQDAAKIAASAEQRF